MTLVAEFHRATGDTVPAYPTPPDKDTARLRIKLITEEFEEVVRELRRLMLHEELGSTLDDRLATMSDLLKELCDLQYVVQGTADALGLGDVFDEAYHHVHGSNMTKVWPDGTVHRRADGKVLKPDYYVSPDMSPFVQVHDHQENSDA